MLMSVIAASGFEELAISASVQAAGVWRSIHIVPGVAGFESECGRDALRWAYNGQCLARARATGQMVRGEHAGFCDLYAPFRDGGKQGPVLVVGPFASRRPTSADVLGRWHELTGARPALAEHTFLRYLAETLATLTLGPLLGKFERWVECCAALLGGAARPEKVATEAEALRLELLRARHCEQTWEAVRSMLDEQTTFVWSTPLKKDPLLGLGMDRPPEHAVVGLLRSRTGDPDFIDEALRIDGAQRALVDLARTRRNVVCGRVGLRGVVLLAATGAGASRARADLVSLAEQARGAGRRFGFRMHIGIAQAAGTQTVAARYGAALAAAERALSRGQSVVFADESRESSARRLADLRARLADAVDADRAALVPRFERYIEAVAAHTGRQLQVTRAYLEAGFERLAEPLIATGRLDRRSFDELCASLDRPDQSDGSVVDLLGAYRRAVADLVHAAQAPTPARHDRSMRRALTFMREHLAERLTLAQLARVAGFAPTYFSKLLRRGQGVTLDQHLQGLRLARAKQILATSTLTIGRVAELSGFRSRTYFQQVFRRRIGVTPIEYRRRTLGRPLRPYEPLVPGDRRHEYPSVTEKA